MSGSSGIIGSAGGCSTTGVGEDLRQLDTSVQSFPSSSEQTRQIVGVVGEVHPENPRFVKAYEPSGAMICEGNWIELNHSADELAERYGTVRAGFKLRVTIWGAGTGIAGNAIIIGTEDSFISEPYTNNEVEQGLYQIFNPGIGVG
jgi:hypothetical protein